MKNQKEKRKRQKLSSIFSNNFYMLKKIYRMVPEYFFWTVINIFWWAFAHSTNGIYTYYILNSVGNGSPFIRTAKIIGILALVKLIIYGSEKLYGYIKHPLIKQKVHLKMHEELFEIARSADLAAFDDPEYYNDFVWAMNESDTRALGVVATTEKFFNHFLAFGTLTTLLVSIDYRIAILIVVSGILSMILRQAGNKVWYEQKKKQNPLWRKDAYINRVYHQADYAKELRITHANDLIMREFDENNEKLEETATHYGKRYFMIYKVFGSILSEATYFGIMLFMFAELMNGKIEIGGFAAAVSVIWQVRWLFTDMINSLTEYSEHSLYIEKYREFIRQKPTLSGGELMPSPFESMEVRDVSFSYEFTNHARYKYHDKDDEKPEETPIKEALRHIDLSIRRGEKIAFVGYNGAGKTTLIKLLLRLYDPTDGEILYNGKPLRDYNSDGMRSKIGVVFQDFKIYAASIAENVINGIYDEKSDKETVLSALHAADFDDKLSSLPDGINTVLTREFDDNGTNLSGGEAQKVAIARVFAHPFELIIMDEPSSALDPMAEYNLNRSIMENAADRTVIFISHRLSTTKMADKIYMLDGGRIIESGTHDELMEQNGKYAEMFNLQAEKYKKQEEE